MPLNTAVFKTRSLTALVFVIVMLGGLLFHPWAFAALFILVHFGCWTEFIRLIKKINDKGWKLYAPAGLAYITLPVWLMLSMGLQLPPLTVANIHNWHFNPLLPCGIIFSIWINDTMAYIVGSLIGKTPFSSISPKKTWEGTVGGALLCVAVIGLLGYFLPEASLLAPVHWIMIAAICAVMGTAGDLLESKLKRMADVKDSGSFMPGHGGFLDRFDSLLVATTFVWLYLRLVVYA